MTASSEVGGWAFVEALYQTSVDNCGEPLEMRLFDPQLAEHLNEEWLCHATAGYGISPSEIHSMISDGLLKTWDGPGGSKGFLLYSEKQAEVIARLLKNPRYSKEEVCHFLDEWNSFIDAIVIQETPYDDMQISDYDHFKRRAAEMVDVFRGRASYVDTHGLPLGEVSRAEMSAEDERKAGEWQAIRDFVNWRTEEELPTSFQDKWKKLLFHLRFVDEYVRIQTANQMAAQIEQGYSPEIDFDGVSWCGTEVTFSNLNWHLTLSRFRQSRKEGNKFPLRTPEFNLTERGIELIGHPSPAEYEQVFRDFKMDELFSRLTEMNGSLWADPSPTIGRVECPECGGTFTRSVASKMYCTDQCRNRAKSRRWRERDPERARLAQARYYRAAYPSEIRSP